VHTILRRPDKRPSTSPPQNQYCDRSVSSASGLGTPPLMHTSHRRSLTRLFAINSEGVACLVDGHPLFRKLRSYAARHPPRQVTRRWYGLHKAFHTLSRIIVQTASQNVPSWTSVAAIDIFRWKTWSQPASPPRGRSRFPPPVHSSHA
jgi:hypothetical protein